MGKGIYKTLGRRVRQERARAGLTQEQLGEKAGCTGAFVAHIERATKHATLDTVERIADAFGLPASLLLHEGPAVGPSKDDPYLFQFARLLRAKAPRQKTALLQVVQAATKLLG